MSVQPSLNSSNMVVAEIINEINSTQPSGNYSQNTRATPIQPQRMPVQNAQQPQQLQRRATPFRRPPEPAQQPRNSQKTMNKPPVRRKSFLQKQKEKMKNKKVRFKEEVEERVIQEMNDDIESESESESESEDTSPIENVIEKIETTKSKKTSNTKPKFLKKDDVQKNDLTETKGVYTRVINFFTNDTKEPLLVLSLVFAISMPIVNKLMTKFLPFLMKYGEGSMFVIGVKALAVALAFFTVKKLLL